VEAGEGGQGGFAGGEVQAGGGFVQEEEVGFADQGAGEEAAEAFAGGEGGIELGAAVGEADLFEQGVGAGGLGGGDFVEAEGEAREVAGEDDVAGGHLFIERVDGRGFDDADTGAEFGDGGLAEGLAEELDFAGLGPEVARGDAEEGGFSGAVGAEDGGDFAWGDLPGDVGEDGARAAGEGDVIELEDGVRHETIAPRKWELYLVFFPFACRLNLRWREMNMRFHPAECPKCKSKAIARIVYGLVKGGYEEEVKSGKVVLGGCVISEFSPAWQCTACSAEFGNVHELEAIERSEQRPPTSEELLDSLMFHQSLSAINDLRLKALHQKQREREMEISSRRCPHCGEPCPRYRLTCRYCRKTVGREPQ